MIFMHHGNYLKKYTSQMTKTMKRMYPDLSEDKIKSVICEMIDERCSNPQVTLDNNQTGESRDTTLLSVLDWALDRQPIIAGNGTFYLNQHEGENPIAEMLTGFLTKRKNLKKIMFSKTPSTPEYDFYDRSQGNQKINANSYYGASGAPSSPFYSKWSGPRFVGRNLFNCWKLLRA